MKSPCEFFIDPPGFISDGVIYLVNSLITNIECAEISVFYDNIMRERWHGVRLLPVCHCGAEAESPVGLPQAKGVH